MNALLLMMGGSGVRFGADIPKQYVLINDKPIFSYILESYNNLECIDRIIVVSNEKWLDYVNDQVSLIDAKKVYKVVEGGETRSESIKNGLRAANEILGKGDVILIHDATHPYVDEKGTKEVIESIKEYGGATLASFNYDTVYRIDDDGFLTNVEPRNFIVAGASPEGFEFSKIYEVYMNSSKEELEKMTSAGAIALVHNIKMKVVQTNVLNLKITYSNDMQLFEKLVDNYFFERDKK